MNLLPTRTHAVIDYAMAVILVVTPFVFMFEHDEAAKWTLIYAGIVTFAASLLTHDELGIAWAIPMWAHLALDILIGVILIASPWAFGFSSEIWWPHVILGAVKILIVLATRMGGSAEHAVPARHQVAGLH